MSFSDPPARGFTQPSRQIVMMLLVLIVRPTGLFGRRFASGAHGKL